MAQKDSSLAYDQILGKLRQKLQRQELTVMETKQHIQAIEVLKDQSKPKTEPTK